MNFLYFSKNGQILPIDQANIPLSNIEYSYGFGVYENLRVRGGIVYFAKQHLERLFNSAAIIDLKHPFSKEEVEKNIFELLEKLDLKEPDNACNLKILLVGGREPQLFILALAPFYPDRKFYSEGVKTITIRYERQFPNAKTLNMLGSYLAYKKAKEQDCYDALLINFSDAVLEGTRTNFFALNDRVLLTPPKDEVLEGVTRQLVIEVARKNGFSIQEAAIPLSKITSFDGVFLTSTSSKIVPIRQVDDYIFQIPEKLKELIHLFDDFLKESKGVV